jgi:hypothetical protein
MDLDPIHGELLVRNDDFCILHGRRRFIIIFFCSVLHAKFFLRCKVLKSRIDNELNCSLYSSRHANYSKTNHFSSRKIRLETRLEKKNTSYCGSRDKNYNFGETIKYFLPISSRAWKIFQTHFPLNIPRRVKQ